MGDTPRQGYRRIVFKPSGEALAGESGKGLDGATLDSTAAEIIDLRPRFWKYLRQCPPT